jgi:hypothetical protein
MYAHTCVHSSHFIGRRTFFNESCRQLTLGDSRRENILLRVQPTGANHRNIRAKKKQTIELMASFGRIHLRLKLQGRAGQLRRRLHRESNKIKSSLFKKTDMSRTLLNGSVFRCPPQSLAALVEANFSAVIIVMKRDDSLHSQCLRFSQ